MLLILSPAKTFSTKETSMKPMTPHAFDDQTKPLIDLLKTYDIEKLKTWMKISQAIAAENYERYQKLDEPKSKGYIALDAFSGEAYRGLEASTLLPEARDYLKQHLIILSGLYGILHPHDILKPYRLEMGSKFENWMYKDLYHYWKNTLTEYTMMLLEKDKDQQVLINLASTEYSKALDLKKISEKYPVITISFKEEVGEEQYKVVGMYAKKARGQMARYIATLNLKSSEEVKAFNEEGYSFNYALSTDDHYVFTRKNK